MCLTIKIKEMEDIRNSFIYPSFMLLKLLSASHVSDTVLHSGDTDMW